MASDYLGLMNVSVGMFPLRARRTHSEWLALSMDDLFAEWLGSGEQTFDEWYTANIPAPDIR